MRKYIYLFFIFFVFSQLQANNISVNNVSLGSQNTTDDYTLVQFDLAWENSWRISVGPANWDAAWVFVKYRVNGNTWRHATLSQDNSTAPAAASLEVVSDQTGAFIYRSADGSGDVNWAGIALQWDYGADGVDENALVDIQVFAIEMVYVPEGSFHLGTGFIGTEAGAFHSLLSIGSIFLRTTYAVQSEAAITISNSPNNLYYDEGAGHSGDQLGPIPAAFPKGYAAFYCMKYEVSQDQWVGFFNTLSQTQKTALDVTSGDGKNMDDVLLRNAVSWPDAGNASTSLPNLPINYVGAPFMMAYMDWAALRPMTELEYEKACRGSQAAVPNEYAWGTTNIHAVNYIISNEGLANEQITNPGSGVGNVAYSQTNAIGMLRCGIFAASATLNNREETGGSYYGIMELTGNLYERAVSVGNPQGRAFTGLHGNGSISATGTANVANWPLGSGEGLGYRGGSYFNPNIYLYVSDRSDAANTFLGSNGRVGFRAVRTAE